MKKEVFYAVAYGKTPGIYKTWNECNAQIKGFPNAKFKKFDNEEDAKEYVNSGKILEYSSDTKKFTEMDDVSYMYCDGSFNASKDKYGFGYLIVTKKEGKITFSTYSGGCGTNPQLAVFRNITGEILGVTEGVIDAIDHKIKTLIIYYDYLGIDNWATGSWTPKNNVTKAYHEFIKKSKSKINLVFVKVPSHTGVAENDFVDEIAKYMCDAPCDTKKFDTKRLDELKKKPINEYKVEDRF